MVYVHLPTTDGRELLLPRRTESNTEQQLLLSQLNLTLPEQQPPKMRENVKSPRECETGLAANA